MRIALFGMALALLTLSSAADPLEQMIDAEQARAMGLHKLDPAERMQLARWIERRFDGMPVPMSMPMVSFAFDGVTVQAQLVDTPSAPIAQPTPPPITAPASVAALEPVPSAVVIGSVAAFGLEQDKVDGDIRAVHARVLGEFTGWEGKTLFKLDNGQVWRQSFSGVYRYKATDPEVVIEKALVGYKLRLVDTKRSVAVRRIK